MEAWKEPCNGIVQQQGLGIRRDPRRLQHTCNAPVVRAIHKRDRLLASDLHLSRLVTPSRRTGRKYGRVWLEHRLSGPFERTLGRPSWSPLRQVHEKAMTDCVTVKSNTTTCGFCASYACKLAGRSQAHVFRHQTTEQLQMADHGTAARPICSRMFGITTVSLRALICQRHNLGWLGQVALRRQVGA